MGLLDLVPCTFAVQLADEGVLHDLGVCLQQRSGMLPKSSLNFNHLLDILGLRLSCFCEHSIDILSLVFDLLQRGILFLELIRNHSLQHLLVLRKSVFALLHVLVLRRFNTQIVKLELGQFFVLTHLEAREDLTFCLLSAGAESQNKLRKFVEVVYWLGVGVLSADLFSLHFSVVLLFSF